MRPRRAIVISLSHIPTDGRVLRQVASLAARGYRVTAIGLAGGDGATDAFASATVLGAIAGTASVGVVPEYVMVRAAPWSMPNLRGAAPWLAAGIALPQARDVAVMKLPGIAALVAACLATLGTESADVSPIVIANDWQALPALVAAKQARTVIGHYDSHELATEEHAGRPAWRLLFPPSIAAVERKGLAAADTVSCVGPGIARALQETYKLTRMPVIVRNVVAGRPHTPRAATQPITVLFHGILKSDRGLEQLIDGVRDWPIGYQLLLRGRAPNPSYGHALGQRIQKAPADLIRLEPMVPQHAVVEAAASADIGLIPYDISLRENRFALPNKLFEYLHAGLVPVVPSGSDAAALLADTGCGLAIDFAEQGALAKRLASLNETEVNRLKAASHAAAQTLTWTNEQERLLALLPPP